MRIEPKVAVKQVAEQFPFPGYMDRGMTAYLDVAGTVLRHLEPGARILDFGSGPCDKTAVLQLLGFECSACDDLVDEWHARGENRAKISAFARRSGVDFVLTTDGTLPYHKDDFDMVMLHNVLEHLHDSPCYLLNDLLELVKPEGYIFVTVPNAVNIRKRIAVLFGSTNLPRFAGYYWYPGRWRGHVREYTKGDLRELAQYLSLDVLELRGVDHMLGKLPRLISHAYLAVTAPCRGWKDTWSLIARKKPGWAPLRNLPEQELKRILGRATSYQY